MPFKSNASFYKSGPLGLVIVLALFGFCRVSARADSHLLSGTSPGSDDTATAALNVDTLNFYSAEWKYNRSGSPGAPPQTGLALSGGGTRAAMFSLGVLTGLNDRHLLDKLDVISSVSGGGYIASWYYMQNADQAVDPQVLFGAADIYQTHIDQHGELLSPFSANHTLQRRLWYVTVDGLPMILSIPVNAFANGLFGWHANTSPIRHIYQYGIDRTYHSVPSGANNRGAFRIIHRTFKQMATSIEKNKLPFFIVNTTAHIEDATDVQDHWLQDHVFEFTPLHCGSDYFGYSADFPFDYNRAISVSGAAWDSRYQVNEDSERAIVSALNADLGYFINNPTTNVTVAGRVGRGFLPIPIYFFTGHHQRDIKGDRIQLADGAHAENLGVFSLVRRGCQHILLVDSGYDPEYKFEDYTRLRDYLSAELHVCFRVKNIESALLQKSFDTSQPVMEGTIESFPTAGKYGLPDPLIINVLYVKLSIDTNNLAQYGPAIMEYYNRTKMKRQWGVESSSFPQESTLDQSYTSDQLSAYRELGRYFINNSSKLNFIFN